MKKILFLILIGIICFMVVKHLSDLDGQVAQIDQISNGIDAFLPVLKSENGISYLGNSPEEVKIHFETQNILAPLIVHKGWQDYDYLLYIEDFNHPPNEGVPVDFFDEIRVVSDGRFHFKLYKRK